MKRITQRQKLETIWDAMCVASSPPSEGPMWRWWEKNISLDSTSHAHGRYSTELVPVVRIWSKHAQNPGMRRLLVMVSAQSTKTQNLINKILFDGKEDPGPTMWVMASKDSAEEFLKTRLLPALENCEAIADFMPKSRNRKAKGLIQLTSMNLFMRGSNSRAGLQSHPIRRIMCDERREWKKGAIGLLRKRLRTFANSQEISTGTAGAENDELHRDWLDGSQGFIHWNCPKCEHSQPFRFGRKASVLFPNDRMKGGLRWSDAAKVDGKWDEDEVRRTTEYECENCGERFRSNEKLKLQETIHEHHRRPERLPQYPSLHWNALYMPWRDCDWGEIAVEFLKAGAALDYGDVEPMKAFVTETLGEPWRDNSESAKSADLLARCGGYKTGDKWPESRDVAQLLTIDVQSGYFVLTHHQFRPGGDTRLVRPFKALSWEECRDYQVAQGVKDMGVFVDCSWTRTKNAPSAPDVFANCLKYNWTPIAGDDASDFTLQVRNSKSNETVSVKSPWGISYRDPQIGMLGAGKSLLQVYVWSKPHYREKLFVYALKGKGAMWEVPDDLSPEYVDQMQNVERVLLPDGTIEWREKGRHDYPDCELMQMAAADIRQITRVLQK